MGAKHPMNCFNCCRWYIVTRRTKKNKNYNKVMLKCREALETKSKCDQVPGQEWDPSPPDPAGHSVVEPLWKIRAARAHRWGAQADGRAALQPCSPARRWIQPSAGHRRRTPNRDAVASTFRTKACTTTLPEQQRRGKTLRHRLRKPDEAQMRAPPQPNHSPRLHGRLGRKATRSAA
jgi:hypothetical protein